MMLVSGGSKRLRLFMSKLQKVDYQPCVKSSLGRRARSPEVCCVTIYLHALCMCRKISMKNEKFCTALFIRVFITFLMNPINDFHIHI